MGATSFEWRPVLWRCASSRIAWAVAVAGLALLIRLPLMLRRQEVLPGGDSAGYVDLALGFLSGESGLGSLVRPPGYPLFLAVAGLLPGRIEDAASVMQLLIGAVFAGAVVLFLWRIFGAIAAVTTGVLVALTSSGLHLDSVLLADGLFGILVCIGCAVLIAAVLTDRRRMLLLAAFGVLVAMATYVKPVGHVLVLAPILPLALATRSLRTTALGAAAVVAVVAVGTVPWMVRNHVEGGSFSMSVQSGRTLFNRAFERDRLPVPTDRPGGLRLQRFIVENPDLRPSSQFYAELVDDGMSPVAADAVQQDLAWTAMRRHPGRVARGVVDSMGQMYDDVAVGAGYVDLSRRGLIPLRITAYGRGVGERIRRVWRLFAFGGLASILWFALGKRRVRLAMTCVLAVWFSVALATAVMHGGQYQYSAALAPLVWLAGSAGLTTVLIVLGRVLAAVSRGQLLATARGRIARPSR